MSTAAPRPRIEPVVVSDEFTVVGLYHPTRDEEQDYQSEAALEDDLIEQLCAQAYEYVDIHDCDGLETNLRVQLGALNDYRFSDEEWKRFYRHSIVDAPSTDGNPVVAKARRIQEDHVQVLIRDDGTPKNISLIDKTNIHRNKVQVIRQYAIDTGARSNRYDVTILVNGLPLVHIELKRRGKELREAFNQIDRYQRDSFHASAGDGLFGYVQIFVISNGAHTKYYSNTVRLQHITENQGTRRQVAAANARSYEFTMWWTDAANNQIPDLSDFTATFLAKRTILAILTRYCVLNTSGALLVMRPYQIAATEAILQRIKTSTMNKQTGTVAAGGYVWHTTGSGKTLTSFKTAKLAAGMEGVDKVLFVVDRKDLDHQTIREYNAFAEGTVSANQSTRQLAKQINDTSTPIIVTTIQKLATFVKSHRGHAIYSGHVVLVFDECHRSQFGDMHTDITRAFRNYHLFGFTGTPIFAENASSSGKANLRTTEQAFGDQLHSYTIVDAIRDNTVLPFRVDYLNSFRVRDGVDNHDVEGIDTDSAYMNPQRISAVVSYILEHFDQKTKRHASFQYKKRRVNGFNSLFATSSIKAARAYYQEFKRQQADLPEARRLSVGIIYSYAPNAEAPGTGLLSEESMDPSALSQDDRAFLDEAIADYNQQFGTNYGSDASGFESYYESLSQALTDKRIDLVIVVDMFLTGFDSKSLNTLWVDKNLRAHGLIQAFSRTNRILNSVKTYGNIVCFRNLEDATNDAIALFGNKEARGQVLLRPYGEYLSTYLGVIEQLRIDFPLPIGSIASEKEQKRFIDLMGQI
ncbi:MAG: type I restriction endonuclease subunit R, partial [Actinomyces sp.]|nr:type I restriction endonuclease subunit R [Actinomyces sp.]